MIRPFIRAMSTTSSSNPIRHRFFVYAPDKMEEGTLARRLAVREKHLVSAKAGHESGFIRSHLPRISCSQTHGYFQNQQALVARSQRQTPSRIQRHPRRWLGQRSYLKRNLSKSAFMLVIHWSLHLNLFSKSEEGN